MRFTIDLRKHFCAVAGSEESTPLALFALKRGIRTACVAVRSKSVLCIVIKRVCVFDTHVLQPGWQRCSQASRFGHRKTAAMLPAMCRYQPCLTSMCVPLPLQLTQLSDSQSVSLGDFCAHLLVRVNPNAGAQSTFFPNTVVRGVHEVFAWLGAWPTLHGEHRPSTPALPGAHASHGVVALLALRCLPASHLMHAFLDTLKYVGYGQSWQLERCVFGRVPAGHRVHFFWPGVDACLSASHAAHAVWFVFAACFPAGHGSHRPSVPAVPRGQSTQPSCFALALLPERQVPHDMPRGEYRPGLQAWQNAEKFANVQPCPLAHVPFPPLLAACSHPRTSPPLRCTVCL